uniref:RNA exonuclease 4 n=1 Tax=Lygus hesperus TaxID=30085 RepID=A0A0A9Y3A9_LYGHE
MKSSLPKKPSKRNLEMNDKEARDQAASKKKKKPAAPLKVQDPTTNKPTGGATHARKSKDDSSTHSQPSNKPKSHSKFANISHKNSTGASNWQKFLREAADGIKRPTVKSTGNVDNKYYTGPRKNSSTESSGPKLTKVVGMDCEMVGIGEDGRDSILARVSIVNGLGDCIYDKYVKPRETVTDYRTYVSGIREEDVADGEEFEVVQKEVADILRRRILVGHAIKNDLEVLFLSHPRSNIRDTAKFFRRGGCKTPSLKTLASQYLDVSIQEGEHSSVQDAKAAVQLYNLYRKQWESGGGNRKHNRIDTYHHKLRNVHNMAEDT